MPNIFAAPRSPRVFQLTDFKTFKMYSCSSSAVTLRCSEGNCTEGSNLALFANFMGPAISLFFLHSANDTNLSRLRIYSVERFGIGLLFDLLGTTRAGKVNVMLIRLVVLIGGVVSILAISGCATDDRIGSKHWYNQRTVRLDAALDTGEILKEEHLEFKTEADRIRAEYLRKLNERRRNYDYGYPYYSHHRYGFGYGHHYHHSYGHY